jgi:hypothetical protein
MVAQEQKGRNLLQLHKKHTWQLIIYCEFKKFKETSNRMLFVCGFTSQTSEKFKRCHMHSVFLRQVNPGNHNSTDFLNAKKCWPSIEKVSPILQNV